LRWLNITNADEAVDLAYNVYGEHSIALVVGQDNHSSSSTMSSSSPALKRETGESPTIQRRRLIR
ncbi:MAG TPA: hypothetical protein VJQ60_15210, partial [Arthrobacter sp.]|nr:hypothetical protein [Arthrobacter sp.]